ncbi:MAG: 16S rRNA (cytosine(1402)-N(4))-methyltransferase RsmH [Eubacterium sp.]|nr:16S rRNA (cytosine(1402)-N(4))-methyltransferase RsmH [Eubacterium sp.]
MEFSHRPVLLDECVEALAIKPDGIYADGTLGGAGHARAVCEALSDEGLFLGIDRDQDALDAAAPRLEGVKARVILEKSNYADIEQVLRKHDIPALDGALLDLGVSSFQLDNPERGFSYMHDAPLDMRMDSADGLTAADVVNTYSRDELTRIIKEYGEERWASRIASFIAENRRKKEIGTTFELVDIIKAAVPASARREGPHPAKRTFQAIRIEVNDELGGLERAVESFIKVLAPGGRLAIITFHSLEDRIVKKAFAKHENPCTCPPGFPVCVCGNVPDARRITKKPIVPGGRELEENPRARSAKLRVLEKI